MTAWVLELEEVEKTALIVTVCVMADEDFVCRLQVMKFN